MNTGWQAVVIEGHTLGVIIGDEVQILRASVVRGSPYPNMGCIPLGTDFRVATRQDFDDFHVTYHPEYLVKS